MIIPDNLSPLPVAPLGGNEDASTAPTSRSDMEGFVSETTVRQLLVGPMKVVPLTTTIPQKDGFAGRGDIAEPEAPFVSIPSPISHSDQPAKPFVPGEPHPALAEPRQAAPPRPRLRIERTTRGNRHRSDRYWVLGMGAAMFVTLLAGALVQFAATKSSPHTELVPEIEAAGPSVPAEVEINPSFAATGHE